MVDNNIAELKLLFGDVNNLRGLVHPRYKEKFELANNERVIVIAKQLSEQIIKSRIKKVVVSETGASPMVYVIKKILDKKGVDIKWIYIKFPRENEFTNQVLLHYLSQKEKEGKLKSDGYNDLQKLSLDAGINEKLIRSWKSKSRENIVNDLCVLQNKKKIPSELPCLKKILEMADCFRKDYFHYVFNIVFRSTEASEMFGQPFLYFDEYIDSGRTLLNAINYFNSFADKPEFKILSYLTKIKESKKYGTIFYTLYDKDTELQCYKDGVYPFENRIDLIGYFYQINEKKYEKVTLENTLKSLSKKNIFKVRLMSELSEYIDKNNLVDKVKQFSNIKQICDYIDKKLVTIFLIYLLEKKFGKDGKMKEFAWLTFDMHGPIWSPMPDSFHLNFWNAFDKLDEIVNINKFHPRYTKERKIIFKYIISFFISQKINWKRDINKLTINKIYANRS